jgi:hypothetical protein
MRLRSIVAGLVFPFTGLVIAFVLSGLVTFGLLKAGRGEPPAWAMGGVASNLLLMLPSLLGALVSGSLIRLFSPTRLSALLGAACFGLLLSTLHFGWSERLSDYGLTAQVASIAVASFLVIVVAFPWLRASKRVA